MQALTYKIIGAAIEVHKVLGGPGLLENIYEEALCHELKSQGLEIERQLLVPVIYKGIKIRESLYLDILVNKSVIIEVKATEKTLPLYEVQLLTYLRLTNVKLGLLINFGLPQIKDGITRIIN